MTLDKDVKDLSEGHSHEIRVEDKRIGPSPDDSKFTKGWDFVCGVVFGATGMGFLIGSLKDRYYKTIGGNIYLDGVKPAYKAGLAVSVPLAAHMVWVNPLWAGVMVTSSAGLHLMRNRIGLYRNNDEYLVDLNGGVE